MVFGNPNRFAILMELIPCWTEEGNYKNGLFHFIVEAKIFPAWANSSTLSGDILCLEKKNNALIAMPENKELFFMDKEMAFKKLLDAMLPEKLNPDFEYPDDFEEDYTYYAGTYNLEDGGCYVYAIGFEENIRILGARISSLIGNSIDGYDQINRDKFNIAEIILPKAEVKQIIHDTKTYFDEKIK